MFSDDEATAIALGLHAVRRLGLDAIGAPVAGALAKLERVLPATARERLRALDDTLVSEAGGRRSQPAVAPALVALLCQAVRERRRVRMHYQRSGSQASERLVSPYGVVCHEGAWYLVGFCLLRGDMRNFRLDRIAEASITAQAFERPPAFDSLSALLRSFAEIPDRWEVDLILHTSLEQAQRALPPELALLDLHERGVRMRALIDDLDKIARVLVQVACPVTIMAPDELRQACRTLAAELCAIADTQSA
jgi:predicted DNA-binding transcriptional regulator YafY